MGRHSKSGLLECPSCGHEEHEEGLCYHCGIFADRYPPDNPCNARLREEG